MEFSISDINGDGFPDLLVGDEGTNTLYAFDGKSGSLLWKFKTGGAVSSSPAIGDIDGDGKPEVVFGSDDNYLYILDGTNGNLKWKYQTGNDIESSPALGDVDRNGKIDIAVASGDGYLYLFEVNRPYGEIVWSRWHGDAQGTGVYQNAKRFALENVNSPFGLPP